MKKSDCRADQTCTCAETENTPARLSSLPIVLLNLSLGIYQSEHGSFFAAEIIIQQV